MAVVVLVAVLVGMAVTPVKEWIAGGDKNNKDEQRDSSKPEFVAKLNDWHNAVWLEDSRPPLRDPRIAVGKKLVHKHIKPCIIGPETKMDQIAGIIKLSRFFIL